MVCKMPDVTHRVSLGHAEQDPEGQGMGILESKGTQTVVVQDLPKWVI